MEYLVGASLAVAVSLGASFVGLDRDRAFYPTVMIVIASLYGLFAVLGGGANAALTLESLVGAAFILLAILGFRTNLWLVVIALALHGVFDSIHGQLISNPGVPSWWPAFCLTYDVVAAGYLACLLGSYRRTAAIPAASTDRDLQPGCTEISGPKLARHGDLNPGYRGESRSRPIKGAARFARRRA